jgi:O-antigen/teichoic acid export membrane protein
LTLKSRVFRAGAWTIVGHASAQALRLLTTLVMTRLLVPEMFGIMALANVLLVGLLMFSDLGLKQNVVQSKRGTDPVYLNTIWTFQILRGFIIWTAALIGSVLIAYCASAGVWLDDTVYSNPQLPYVVAVLSFNAVISGFESTRIAQANRQLSVSGIVRIELASQLVALVLMSVLGLLYASIWALVVGALASNALRVVLSHTLLPGEANRLMFNREAAIEIFAFGKWIFFTSITGFLAASGDRVMLGSLVNPTTLGLYSIAFLMVGVCQDVFSKLIGNVAFPALGEVGRERSQDLKRTYYGFRKTVDMAALFTAGFLFTAGHLIIVVLYDQRYQDAGHMLEILCLSIFEVRFWLAYQCFLVLGRPNLLLPAILLKAAVIYIAMPLAYGRFGLEGALWAIACSSLVTIPVTLWLTWRYKLLDVWREVVVLPWLLVGYVAGKGIVWAFGYFPGASIIVH